MTPLLYGVLCVAMGILGACAIALIIRVAQLFPDINRWKR